ncbi:hypothetical protein BH11ARM2_BH11ARM2_38660 [soil metagenome]
MLGEIGIDRAVFDECLSDRGKEIEKVGAILELVELDQTLSHDWPSIRHMLANGLRNIEIWPSGLGPCLDIILPPKMAREEDRHALAAFEALKKRLDTPGYVQSETSDES